MDLYSCSLCGVVLDRSRFTFPEAENPETGEPNTDRAVYFFEQGRYVPFLPCPVCKYPIPQEDGEFC